MDLTKPRVVIVGGGFAGVAAAPIRSLVSKQANCRVLMNEPALVLADEPTGNLDTATSNQVVDLLRERNAESATAFLIVTHDPALARRCDRVVELVDGVVVYDGAPSGMKSWD